VVCLVPCDQRVAGSNPILALRKDFGQVLHLQLSVKLRDVNIDSVLLQLCTHSISLLAN